jgi:putative glycosyltransferase (TIGR04372 family)
MLLKNKNYLIRFFKKQYLDIKSGGLNRAIKKLCAIYFIFLQSIDILFINILFSPIRLISPLIHIRIGRLISHRIGHFSGNTELYLCEKDAGLNFSQRRSRKTLDIFYLKYSPVCNLYLLKMWKRVLHILPKFPLNFLDSMLDRVSWGANYQIGENYQYDRDVLNLLENTKPHLLFLSSEKAMGERYLRRLGIPSGHKYICLMSRDDAYLKSTFGQEYSYHNYRDSDVNNYKLAIEYLMGQGYYVVRMGSVVKNHLDIVNDKFIDYATNGARSEFLDIYLCANCHFALSGSLGLDNLPLIFRRPVAYVNLTPFGYFPTYRSSCILLGKKYLDSESGMLLSQKEIVNRHLGKILDGSDFLKMGIEVIENSPDEIRDVCIEMNQKLMATWTEDSLDREFQERFWKNYPQNGMDKLNKRKLHGNILASYSAIYLRKNHTWFL